MVVNTNSCTTTTTKYLGLNNCVYEWPLMGKVYQSRFTKFSYECIPVSFFMYNKKRKYEYKNMSIPSIY